MMMGMLFPNHDRARLMMGVMLGMLGISWLHNYADYNDLAAPTYAYWNDPDHTTAAAGPTCAACAGNAGPTSPP